MGCVASRIDKNERVQMCKERKKLIKRLVGLRGEFADAQLAYLQALKNAGGTLRQFTESESLELDNVPLGISALPPSPPPPLPPSPPPLPPFSPDVRKVEDNGKEKIMQEDYVEFDKDDSSTPLPPPVPNSSWDFWDPFGPSSVLSQKKSQVVQQVEEEDWAETNTEFEEEEEEEQEEEEAITDIVLNPIPEKPSAVELTDDNSSIASFYTKDTEDMPMVVWRSKKTLTGIVKELDDYFLKASAGGKEIAVLLDISKSDLLHQNFEEKKRKRCSSAKVFTALSRSWSSKSLQSDRHAVEFHGPSEPCKPGAHCITLDKLHVEERRLYQDVKEEALTQLKYGKKFLLLQKQESGDQDWEKTEKTRLIIEGLQSEIMCLQQSISTTCSSILKLRDEVLHPQLVELSSGLLNIWRTMYECHQVQNHIAQQVDRLTDHASMEPTTEFHRQATAQLEAEVTAWYNSFCNLLKSQRDYVRALNRWVQLTDCLDDDQRRIEHSSGVHALCGEWELALDRLPDKVTSEAIKSFVSVIHSIVLQQADERNLNKKFVRLEKRLQKELNSLSEMEKKLEENSTANAGPNLSPNHPLSVKRAKTEAFKKRVEDEKAKYLNSVQVSRAMTQNNLKTSLPNVFQALTGFSSVCAQAFEAIHSQAKSTVCHDSGLQL